MPSFVEGVTVVAATSSSAQFAKLFFAAFQQGVESVILDGPSQVSPKWLVDNQSVWLNACLILQDVSSTGLHLKGLQELCTEYLKIPIPNRDDVEQTSRE